MQQGDTSNSYYQFYQSHFHNPNPNPTPNPIDPQFAPYSAADQLNYSSGYPPYAQNPDQIVSSVPTAPAYPTNPNPQFSSPSLYPYDQNYPPLNYPPPVSNPNPSYSGPPYPPSYGGASGVPSYDLSLDNSKKFDSWGGYVEENLGAVYGPGFDQERFRGDGVYRYEGGKVEPYGARGAAGGGGGSSSSFSSNVMFDDYGRPINVSSGAAGGGSKPPSKVVRAVPKVEMEEDVKGGVQKFRVKLLSEGYGQSDTDVLCQIGLDGIRMLDPATSRTLRIYSLDTVTRSDVLDSHIFAFWAKTSVDIEPKRIRLKSNSYTTNTILDAVTAASVQLKEIGESRDSNSFNASDLQFERKKGFGDWMNLIKPPNEEKDHWVPDEAVTKCTSCSTNFNAFVRKHHCRNCGEIFCDKCTQGRTPLTSDEQAQPVRVCDRCMGEVTERLANAGEAATRTGATHSHEDLARKLKEQMDRNLKASSGSKSEGSQTQMREVACPTCTVHLQVEVPSTGSETIECSVCQHPFLVNAN